MALQRIGWENGTLVEPAKMLSDGTVQPAQYEGTTPLSADNLKKMENNTEDFVNEQVGDLNSLNTTDKSSLVNAINSMFPENVIVETGSNSNGIWRKYANGDMECWFTQTVEKAINVAWGSMYNSGEVPLHNFPQTFISKPTVLIDFETSGGWLAFLGRPSTGGNATTENPGSICLLRGTSCGPADFNINVYAKGKWK